MKRNDNGITVCFSMGGRSYHYTMAELKELIKQDPNRRLHDKGFIDR